MNKVIITGRMTKDAEVKQTASQKAFTSFSIAVDRRFKDANGNRGVDFINVVAWGQQAGLVAHYFPKGSQIGIVGTLQSRSYDDPKTGEKRYVTEVVADEIDFIGGSKQNEQKTAENAPAPAMPTAPAQNSQITAEQLAEQYSLPFDLG